MLEQARARRVQYSHRSQLATELLLTTYALVGSIIILRTILVIFGVSNRIWIGSFVYGLTNPVTTVLSYIPGATRPLWGNLTTVDFTLVALLLLFLLGIVASGRNRNSF